MPEDKRFEKIFYLCESNPDAGLEFIEKAIREEPVLESYVFLKVCRARAYQVKGVRPVLDRPWVEVGVAGPEELRLYIEDENLNYLELALSEIKQIENADPEVMRIWGAKGEEQVDAMSCILERCRPGRVQQILGRIKINYFGVDRIRILPSVEEKLPPEKLRPFLDTPFSFSSIIKSALVFEAGRDASGRKYIHCMLFGKLFDDFEPGETFGDAKVGTIYLFDDGTFAETVKRLEVTLPYCRNCGREIAEHARFCPYCGKEIHEGKQIQPKKDKPKKEEHMGGKKITEALRISAGLEPGNDKKLLSLVDEALRLGLTTEDKAIAHYIRGQVYFDQKRLFEAEAEIKRALLLDPLDTEQSTLGSIYDHYDAWETLADICEEKGEIGKAFDYHQKATDRLQTLHKSPKRLIARAYFEFADFLYRRREELSSAIDLAFQYLERAREADPKFPETYFLLGAFHSDKGEMKSYYNPRKAIEYYGRYLTLAASSERSVLDLRSLPENKVIGYIQQKLKLLKNEIQSNEE